MPEKHEKRRHFRGKPRPGRRVELKYRKLEGETDADQVSAVTRNIGVGGAYILTAEPQRVGVILKISLSVPTGDGPIDVVGEVRWCAPAIDETGLAGMGVRFIDLDVDSLLALSEYFASLTGAD